MNFLLKGIAKSQVQAEEKEIEEFVSLWKKSNLEAVFHGFPVLSQKELLHEQWKYNRTKAERLLHAFRTVSDQWTRSEAEQWQKEAKTVKESLERVNRLVWNFEGVSPFDLFE